MTQMKLTFTLLSILLGFNVIGQIPEVIDSFIVRTNNGHSSIVLEEDNHCYVSYYFNHQSLIAKTEHLPRKKYLLLDDPMRDSIFIKRDSIVYFKDSIYGYESLVGSDFLITYTKYHTTHNYSDSTVVIEGDTTYTSTSTFYYDSMVIYNNQFEVGSIFDTQSIWYLFKDNESIYIFTNNALPFNVYELKLKEGQIHSLNTYKLLLVNENGDMNYSSCVKKIEEMIIRNKLKPIDHYKVNYLSEGETYAPKKIRKRQIRKKYNSDEVIFLD